MMVDQSSEGQKMERGQKATLGCSCGYPLACEVEREGERLGFLAFFDGERIEHCPGCGQRLALHGLLPRRLHERLSEKSRARLRRSPPGREKGLFGPIRLPHTGQIDGRRVARTPFRTVSEGKPADNLRKQGSRLGAS
jgi:hypothetical protein